MTVFIHHENAKSTKKEPIDKIKILRALRVFVVKVIGDPFRVERVYGSGDLDTARNLVFTLIMCMGAV
jgi:hypothetical protein